MDLSHSSALSSVSQNFVLSDVVDESCVPSRSSLNSLTEEIVAYERENDETHAVKNLDALCTPESFVTHSNFDTPGGTVYYIPKVSAAVLLVKGNVYDSVDDCVVAYMKYAAEAGFVVRRSCQKRMLNGDVRQKYLVCNRMGCPKGIHVDTLDLGNSDKQKRNSNLHITGCKARAVFNLDTCTRKFVLKVFDTIHNHELEREEYKHLSKTERQLTYMEQAFIVKAASVNIGATRAHHLLTGIKGSYLLVHGTTVDFKNFFRSVNCYIGDSDAQMLIHKMENRKKHVSDFSFDYLVENAELTAIFWADEVSKYNYREFGDVVSFDATFKTNKYKMVFVPFTAIDNHRKCVTVAAGLLKNETTKSYIWLLKAFMKAFGKAPSIVVTDQDGAMRNAIEAEFGGSKHRLCMWHITQKLPAKICAKIYDETDFKEKLNKIVWNMYIGPEEFEYRWGKLMEEFKLENHKWLTKMFNIRSTWIPTYFIDSPLCGLMRTTSRHVQERMDHKTIDTVPKLKTLLKIEHHASNVYTRSLFELVQKEIVVGLFHFQIDLKCLVEGSEVCIIKESPYVYEMPNKKKKKRQSVDKGNDKAEENDKVDLNLPTHFSLRNKRNRYGEKNVVVENYANEATFIVDHCVHLLSKDEPRLGAFVEKLKSLKKEVEADCPNPPSKNKTDNLEQLVGVPKPACWLRMAMFMCGYGRQKASRECLDVVKSLMACKPKPRASICAFVLEMKRYFDRLESLNMAIDAELSINKILSAAPVLTVGHNAKKIKTSHSNWKGKAAKGKSDRGSKRKAESEIAPTSDPKEVVVMYSPNHPTSGIEDAFSSNFPDFIPASPDYVPASPGKIYSSSSNSSYGVVPIASPTLSLFHNDPFMKVIHAYYAKE
ncbi:FAR1-related sequence 5-like protein, partial [Tanacetum coccineum]